MSVDSWVTIHTLKLLSDGGILDPDDKLNDVADDREQITAVFDEELSSYLMHNGGDGTSASSVGTESPDLFRNGDLLSMPLRKPAYAGSQLEIKEEKITAEISPFLPLHVRRGSEPALNRLSPSLLLPSCKRWSAAVLASDDCFKRLNSEGEEQSEDEIPQGEREDGSGEEKSASFQGYLWNPEPCLSVDQRKEPLGGPIISPRHSTSEADESDCSTFSLPKVQIMKLKNEDGPLGIEIVPADKSPDKYKCVKIQHIVPGGRIDRDGRFDVGDHITEINGLKLNKDSYQNANEILKDAMKAPELSIHCIKGKSLQHTNCTNKQPPPPTLPKPLLPTNKVESDCDKNTVLAEKASTVPNIPITTPTKNFLANVLLHKGTPGHSSIRKVGRRILVHLTKGPEGLGFSITSKDPNNSPPFFIKNILPAGAAVDDGRLKTGDKLLEVNKLDVSNLTQNEVLTILRKIPFGDVVELVISRQDIDLSPSPSLPRQLPPEKGEEEIGIVPWKRRDVFTYEVPLNDTGSAGLGVSVKGKTSNTAKGPVDMGIFLKNIFHGGAAHKDGRLRNNDQLLNVNGISLLSMTNGQAMETLRRAMIQNEGPNNAIILTVSRRVSSKSCENLTDNGESSGHDRSDSLLSESGDSFYVSNENISLQNQETCPNPENNTKFNGATPDTSTSDHSTMTVIFRTPNNKGTDVPVSKLVDISPEDEKPTQNELQQQKFVSDLISLSEENAIKNYDTLESFKGNGSLRSHNKTFSNLTEVDLYNSSASETEREPEARYCDTQMSFRETTKRKRFPGDRNDYFRRNGLSRQSMPEKKLSWVPPRNQCLTNGSMRDTSISSPQSPRQPVQSHDYSERIEIREMPVDVGPVESSFSSLKAEKMHRAQGSCNSPDCPYHAVPTTESTGFDEVTAQVGPSLGLYKSSSLESLQTMLHEKRKQSLHSPGGNTSRGCNESFRAAVDKSFEAVDDNADSSDKPQHPTLKHHTRAKTENAEKKDSKSNKKKGLFRGLGSVFRFGKSSKKGKEIPSTSCKTAQSELVNLQSPDVDQIEHERTQTHPKSPASRATSFTFPRLKVQHDPAQQSRQDRMTALRMEHQKRHRQRNGFYPQEDREESYERNTADIVDVAMVNRPLPPLPHQTPKSTPQRNTIELSPKSKDFEIYKEMS
ncbi:hypothetical protein JTE90_000841, partial [Oedothorax gibbosus]